MFKKYLHLIFIFCIINALFFTPVIFAKTDLSIAETDITLSKDQPLAGDIIRVYARIFNTGDVDASGRVIFLNNGKEMAEPQPVSVRAGTYDDVFIDWTTKEGTHNIKASIISLNPKDDNLENNSTTKTNIVVDIDTDKDGTPDLKDTDADNDGLSNEEEQKIGTNPLLADTDGDSVNDKIDAFPKDSSETRDTDNDSLGDNKDLDDDGDGIFDDEELYKYGTNSLGQDSDSDGLLDKQEVDAGTNPAKADSDGDAVNDKEDGYPLDPSKWQAGLFGPFSDILKGKEFLLALGIPAIFIILLLFRRKKRR